MGFFSAVICICWVKAGHNLHHNLFYHFFWAQDALPRAPSISLQWAITVLRGVDTFSCSSICSVVINFLSIIGLSYNIVRLEAACSPCNQSGNQDPITISLISSWIIQSYCDPKRPDSVTDEYYKNMRLICMLLNVAVFVLCVFPSVNCTITIPKYARHQDKWFAVVDKHRSAKGVQKEINIIYCLQTTQTVPWGGCSAGSVCIPAQTCGERERERGRVYQLPSWPQLHSLLFCLYQIKLQCYSREI